MNQLIYCFIAPNDSFRNALEYNLNEIRKRVQIMAQMPFKRLSTLVSSEV